MTHDLWATLNFKMYEYLTSVTLADLVNRQLEKGDRNKTEHVLLHKDQRRIGPRPRAKLMAVIA
jgi:Rrf2 family iron-sulfur cluster assembly transcriptional regulator